MTTQKMFTPRSIGVALCCVFLAAPVWAQPHARNPLPRPRFSIDAVSPSIVTVPIVGAEDVLEKGGMFAMISIAGGDLGLLAGDDINAVSAANPPLPPGAKFNLFFSVDRFSVGSVAPVAGIAPQFPYNVQQQAILSQAAGDEFMALAFFDKTGIVGVSLGNNVMVANQCDVGGVDHGLLPASSPDVANPDPLDDLNAHFRGAPGGTIYFSIVGSSDILCDLDGDDGVAVVVPYAGAPDLSIDPVDDVDGLTVFDAAGDCLFDPSVDQILFSLQRGNASGFSPGDVLATPPGPGPGPIVIAPANELGLLPDDDVSSVAMQQAPNTEDILTIVDDVGIRPFAVPAASTWGLIIFGCGLLVFGSRVIRKRAEV
jgi:hypothetical protein